MASSIFLRTTNTRLRDTAPILARRIRDRGNSPTLPFRNVGFADVGIIDIAGSFNPVGSDLRRWGEV
jgi:hypothetical protein